MPRGDSGNSRYSRSPQRYVSNIGFFPQQNETTTHGKLREVLLPLAVSRSGWPRFSHRKRHSNHTPTFATQGLRYLEDLSTTVVALETAGLFDQWFEPDYGRPSALRMRL